MLYIITNYKDREQVPTSLCQAAEQRSVPVQIIHAPSTDFFALPTPSFGDMVFRLGISDRAFYLEKILLSNKVAHVYKNLQSAFDKRISSYFSNELAGLPTIKTIPLLPTQDSDLSRHVDYLCGFPVVVKVSGNMHGVGVMRADTMESLSSILDFVRSQDQLVLLRQYISHEYYGRLVVVGDKVVGSHRTYNMPGEFRTNAPGNLEENKQAFDFDSDIQAIAIEAVHSTGVNFGGVDLLFDDSGKAYIAEVNFPCAYSSTERIAGVDIAGPIIDYLLSQSRNIVMTQT